MLTITIKSTASLHNIAQGLLLLKERIVLSKSRINPGTEGASDLHLYYQEKLNEITGDQISVNHLIDKNFKVPHFFCLRNETAKDSVCVQQCQNCQQNII